MYSECEKGCVVEDVSEIWGFDDDNLGGNLNMGKTEIDCNDCVNGKECGFCGLWNKLCVDIGKHCKSTQMMGFDEIEDEICADLR